MCISFLCLAGCIFFNSINAQVKPVQLGTPDKIITIKDGLLSNYVYGCVQDNEGFMWFYTNQGVSKYDGHQFKNFTVKDGLPTNDIWLMTIDLFNRKWLHCLDRSIYYIENDKIVKAANLPDIYSITSLESDQEGNMTCKEPNYYFQLKRNGDKFDYVDLRKSSDQSDWSPNYSIQYWEFRINSRSDTISIIDTSTHVHTFLSLLNKELFRTPIVFQHKVYLAYSKGLFVLHDHNIQAHYRFLTPLSINRSFIDKDGNIWVTTRDNGVLLYKNSTQLASRRNCPLPMVLSRTIPYNQSKLFIDAQSSILQFNEQTLSFTPKFNLSGTRSICSFFDNIELLHTDGATYFTNKTLQLHELGDLIRLYPELEKKGFSTKGFKYGNDSIISILRNRECHLLTRRDHLIRDTLFHKNEEKLQKVFYDQGKNILVFSKYQLHIYNPSLHIIDSIELTYHGKQLSILCIAEDTIRHELWIGTNEHGLFVLKNRQLTNKIENTDIKNILLNQSKVIYSNDNGVFVYNRKNTELEFQYAYTSKDGIAADQLIDIKLKNDTLIAILRHELLLYDINHSIRHKDSLMIYSIVSDSTAKDLHQFIHIPYNHKQLMIKFSLFNYNYEDEVKYFYSLDNTGTWIPLESNQIILQGLAGGVYQLHIVAKDKYSNSYLAGNNIRFEIEIPWWKSNLFIICINLFLFVLLFYLFRKWIERKAQRENKLKEMELKMKELKLNALESQMNPHFIYNSLSSIQYYIQENKKEQAEFYLTRFSKLVRSYLEASRKQNISIKEEIELLERYISLEKLRYEDKFDYELIVDADINQTKTFIQTMLLQPFVENAIQHGLFHRPQGGQIKIRFKKMNTDLLVTISDNGIGIEKSIELKKSNKHIVNSRAMEIFKEKLDVINKIRPDSIEYMSDNLDDHELEYKGTRTTICFKKVCL